MWWAWIALLLLPGVAQAQLYKCQNDKGKWIYQDVPCAGMPGEPAPLPPRQATPAELLTEKEQFCKSAGETAATFAEARDRGVPLTTLLGNIRPILQKDPIVAILEPVYTAILYEIYEKRWWTPSNARQRMELACLQAWKS